MPVISDSGNPSDFEARTDHSETDSTAESGGGGGVMPLWTSDRVTILKSFIAGGSLNNNSSFDTPNGVVGTTSNPPDFDFDTTEKFHGINVKGKYLDADGRPLAGQAKLFDSDGGLVSSSRASGAITATSGPPGGVASGGDVSSTSFTFRYVPNVDAIPDERTGITVSLDVGNVQYGELNGTVTDYNGDPVEGESVSGADFGTATDSGGDYKVLVPGGTSVDITTLGGSITQTLTPTGGAAITQDFQYGAIDFQIRLPDGTGVPEVPISPRSSNEVKKTTDAGRAEFNKVGVSGTVTVVVGANGLELTTTAPSQGEQVSVRETLGFGIRGRCTDLDNRPVEAVDVKVDRGNPIISETIGDGLFAVGDRNAGDVEVKLSEEDRRYEEVSFSVNVSDGETITDREVELERSQETGNK